MPEENIDPEDLNITNSRVQEENTDQPQPTRIPVNPNTWIILGCIIALIVTMSMVMSYMMKHVEELRSSPFVYGAQKMSEKYNGEDVSCTCRAGVGSPTRDPFFYFNATTFWTDEHERISVVPNFNTSEIKFLLSNSS